ncbi:MAG: hypothetical protein ABH841_01470 [Candidatus Nealsonbacteria bacterium]
MIKEFQTKGITLIETVIAVSVLAVGIVGVLQAFPLSAHLAKTAQMSTVAVELGQAKIEQEIAISYNDIPAAEVVENYGAITDFVSYKRVTKISCVRVSDLTQVDCDYDVIDDPSPMKKIEVSVCWRSIFGLAEKSISLMSLIVKK